MSEKAKELMRDAFCAAFIEEAETNANLIYLDADLVSAFGTKKIFERFPERAIQCGIAEANMIGVAAGLSALGKIPFAHSFGCFTSRRACDQIMISCAYAGLNVRLIGSDPGITAAANGGTHMPFEDMSVLRGIPGITLIDVTDPVMLRSLIKILSSDEYYGVYYLRFPRKNAMAVYNTEDNEFTIGKARQLREGCDVTILASGIMVSKALDAADELHKLGISARVADTFTWKPLDTDYILSAARETGAVVTAENHNFMGGLYSAVSEVTAAQYPVPIERVAVEDRFGQVGDENFLANEYGLTAEHIVSAAKTAISRKSGQPATSR